MMTGSNSADTEGRGGSREDEIVERQKIQDLFLIKNGYVIDPRTGQEGEVDILTGEGKILRMGDCCRWTDLAGRAGLREFDARGLIVAPGLVDVHAHFRDPGFVYKEDIVSGSRAAARGGFTTVVLMANTRPAVDNGEVLAYVLEKGKGTGIHVESCAAVTKGLQGKELTDMEGLLAAGAVGFTDDGIPLGEETARQAMKKAAELGAVLSFHEEDPVCIVNNGIHAGAASAHFGIGGSPREAEIRMVERDIRLAQESGAVVNFQHISTKEAVELIRCAKENNVQVHAEATPHHFTLTQDAAIKYGTLAKMNPPLREEADRKAIIEGLRDDTIDLIATDHAPHGKEEKEKPITLAPSGIIGLETALALGITSLVKTGEMTLMSLLEKMTWNPARMYGLDRGYLAEGAPADLVIFDADKRWKVERFVSKACNSPFTGWELCGKVEATVCGGRLIYETKEESDRQGHIAE